MVRNEVHIVAGLKNDQMTFALQPQIAAALGYEGDDHRSPEEVFMAEKDVAHAGKARIAGIA